MGESDRLIATVRESLVAAVPSGWARITLAVWGSVLAYQLELSVVMTDGESPEVELPEGLDRIVAALRTEMYEPDRGTWLSARFILRPGESPDVAFNCYENPRWWPYMPPTVFSRDLEAFPRTLEHIPDWLRVALIEAAEFERRTGAAPPGTG
jgi:hypothetical protein